MTRAPARPVRGFWRTLRVYFRRFRIAVWLCVLLLIGALLYLNQVGLPNFVKRPLLQRLHARGLDLQFSRLRLRWYEGIVAENVRFGRAGDAESGQLTIGEVKLLLNSRALLHGRLQVDQLVLSQGRLAVPLATGDNTSRLLCVEHIQTDLRLLPDDQWALDNFKADFAGAKIQLSGAVTNASAVADWEFFRGGQAGPASSGAWQRRLRRLADTLDRIHFSSPPELRLDVRGDARDLQTFTVRLGVEAPGAVTPWGTLEDGKFLGRLLPGATNGGSHADLALDAATAHTRWAAVTNLHLTMALSSGEEETNLIRGELKLSAAGVHTRWAGATNAVFSATWVHALTNPVPLSGAGDLQCDSVETRWAGARRVELTGTLLAAPGDGPAGDESWGWWTNLQPFALSWQCRILQAQSPDLASRDFSLAGDWRAPRLSLTNLDLALERGTASVRANLDVASRRLQAAVNSDLDPHELKTFFPETARRWLDQFSWETAPRLSGQLEVSLPSWTNSHPDWRGEVQPTVNLSGQFTLGEARFRGVTVTSAQSHFSYSNRCWCLPDLAFTTAEGRVDAEHRANEATRDFYWRINSTVDPRRVLPLLPAETQESCKILELSSSPTVVCEVWGRSRDPERIGLRAQIALTNFVFRGQAADWLETSLEYTNRVLQAFHPRVQRGEQKASVDGLMADFNRELIFLTNGLSTFDPMIIAGAIGPKIGRTVAPYRFEQPPNARVYGTIPMHGETGADLHFDLEGGPFTWWRFHVPQLAGHVHWVGRQLFLENVRLDLYGGEAAGSARFDFLPRGQGTDFTFGLATTNTLLQGLMADLSTRTNHLEGWLSGRVTITKGNTESWTSVFGFGDVSLRDGLLWDIPVFGIFSPVLNGLAPGLGNFRAGAGTGSFIMTNGVIYSEDLQIRSPMVRLQYRGTLDLQARVKARVEAELLRDVSLVGPIVSTVLWPVTKMFEYKVTGSLSEPKLDPVYIIPKLVLLPFHPWRTLKSLLPQDAANRTNAAPPVFQNLDPQAK